MWFTSNYGNSVPGGSFVLGRFLSSLLVGISLEERWLGVQSASAFNASAWSPASSNKMSSPSLRFTGNFQYRWLWSINSTVPDKSDLFFYLSPHCSHPFPLSFTLCFMLQTACIIGTNFVSFFFPVSPLYSLALCILKLSVAMHFFIFSLFSSFLFTVPALCHIRRETLHRNLFYVSPSHDKTALHLPSSDSFHPIHPTGCMLETKDDLSDRVSVLIFLHLWFSDDTKLNLLLLKPFMDLPYFSNIYRNSQR